MAMDPASGASRRLKLTPIVAQVGGRRFGNWFGKGFAKPLAKLLKNHFEEADIQRLTSGAGPLSALGVDAAWLLVAETMSPGRIVSQTGEERQISDGAWEGFILELQQALKERNEEEMAKPKKDDKDKAGKGGAGSATPPPPPPPPTNPLIAAVTTRMVAVISDDVALARAADRITREANVRQQERYDLQAVVPEPQGFWAWLWRGVTNLWDWLTLE